MTTRPYKEARSHTAVVWIIKNLLGLAVPDPVLDVSVPTRVSKSLFIKLAHPMTAKQ